MELTKILLSKFRKGVENFVADEDGATAAEYGIIAALIAVIIIGAIRVLGVRLQTVFRNITNSLPSGSP